MDSTEVNTAVTFVSIVVTLLSMFGKPVYNKLEESGLFIGNDIITIGDLADNPEDAKTQGKLEGIIETRISKEEGFEAKLNNLIDELQKPESIEYFKYNKQIGNRNENDQKGGDGPTHNLQVGNDNKNLM